MALHAQQQILDAVHAVLLAGGTAAGSRVFLDRVDPLQASELPGLLVEEGADGESADVETIHGLERRSLLVLVRCVVSHGTTAGADARALGLQVEKLLAASSTLAALATGGVNYVGSRIEIVGDADRLMAERLQDWRFTYFVRPEAPDVIL
jgi:hypothetical protein